MLETYDVDSSRSSLVTITNSLLTSPHTLSLSPSIIGTATPTELRSALHLQGLSPAKVESFELQKKRALAQLRSKSSDIEKYVFLAWLRNTNVRLFYGLVGDQLEVRELDAHKQDNLA